MTEESARYTRGQAKMQELFGEGRLVIEGRRVRIKPDRPPTSE